MNEPRSAQIQVHADYEQLSRACAGRWVELCREAIADHGTFHVALAGGSTPRRLYALLAEPEFAEAVDWGRVQVYFGDERSVPPDHPDSNFRMAREQLLDHVPLPRDHVHPILADAASIERDAAAYAEALHHHAPRDADGFPKLDLILLGTGEDGHTASLFPGTPILEERHLAVAAVHVERLSTWRVSLTLPVLERAGHLLFEVSGADKAPIIGRIFRATEAPPLPVQRIAARGTLEWHLDRAAAAELDP